MLNHLLPMLRHPIYWEAYGGDVVLMGVEGEIYIKAPEFQKPIEERIEPGFVHAGNAIRRKLDLSVGDRVEILGEFFTVRRMLPEKGNVDDISLLMNLTDVQRLAELPGKVGGILALSCECAGDGTDLIRSELDSLVPNVQVVEFTVRARARKRARDAVAQRTEEEINDIRGSRGAMRDQMTRFAALLIALVTGGAVTLLFVLTLVAVRERRVEMAMLRALGLPSSRVVVLLLLRTTVTGLAGGVAGCGLGALAAHYAPGQSAAVSLSFMACVMGATVLIAIVASGIPAALAARTDPAVILNQE
jgi:ABC-type lipoprotein release transport system permease subunit